LLRSMTARSCRLVRCTIQGALLRCNIFRTIHRRAFRKKAESMTYRESPGVAAARSAGLVDHYCAQLRQGWAQPLPDPGRQALAGGVLQARHVVEAVVV